MSDWWKKYEPTLKQKLIRKLHLAFNNFICYLTSDLGWDWLDAVIDALCYLEVNLKLAKRKEFRDNLYCGDVCVPGGKTWCHEQIPADSLYCDRCPFAVTSKIATLFYGSQMNGFCYYLNQGDFTFGHPTDLLWDGCKCCGVSTDIEDDIYENMEECEEEYITTDIIEDVINETKIEKDENFYSTTDESKYF